MLLHELHQDLPILDFYRAFNLLVGLFDRDYDGFLVILDFQVKALITTGALF